MGLAHLLLCSGMAKKFNSPLHKAMMYVTSKNLYLLRYFRLRSPLVLPKGRGLSLFALPQIEIRQVQAGIIIIRRIFYLHKVFRLRLFQ